VPGVRCLLAALVLVGAGPWLVGCSADAPADAPAGASAGTDGRRDPRPVAPDVRRGLEGALRVRAEAVRRDDTAAFESGLAPRRPRLLAAQRTYLANLAQLPLARFSYTLDPRSLTREHDDYWVEVAVHLQLEGFDAVPVTTPDRFRFTPARGHPGRYLLASTTDRAWEGAHHVEPQPWDAGPITVRTGRGVLAVFDAESLPSARGVVAAVQRGIVDVTAHVPYPWSRSVVVYALSDPRFLAGVEDLPGGDPATVDGVSFPVRSGQGDDTVAAVRIVLSPRLLDRPGPERERLVRHELTHVAVGAHDDRAPVWLAEGLAEYVSVRAMAPEDRLIAPAAVRRAAAGIRDLPADATFNDEDYAVHYAVAWWACEYLADNFGEPTLWTLLAAMGERGADADQVLREQVLMTPGELAEHAARQLVAAYRPAPGKRSGSRSNRPSPTPSA
jgi:hypothetical protein